ncbi:MAG: type II toxin-antitoxin system Phd/YefM family antitoxin [Caldilineaceae bacterium]|nr:type II toxin-antitoxin system Phd/YefM family antitoxin [Caldilineaceae bacterium]MBP8107053.1 type II toxin-antitoxin system Phd/YefM family antitoxin [Caldilineaceae bacterium]MBP8121091.1 type II toxin-antitoxin system Phd/YefM family antitoxin [Caldilineaceae bacterium]MBP9070792.1 type II toxin-antitoxin system Phd/YefM family antitoxin [Caldilineaceae bacterium]
MRIVSVSDAKRQIKDLVEQAAEHEQVYYITRYSQAQAVMLGVEHYENLLQRMAKLEDEVRRVWTAVEAEESAPHADSSSESLVLPTADGGWRTFYPARAASPQVHAAIQRAAKLAWRQRDWTPQQGAEAGRQSLERARQRAIENGTAIELEAEAALND